MSFSTRLVSARLIFPLVTCVFLLLPLASSATAAGTVVNAISHNTGEKGVEVVEFWLSTETTPKVFLLPGETPRLVIDFFNAKYGGPTRIVPAEPHLVQSIRVGLHDVPKPKTRVVIDLLPAGEIDWNKTFIHHDNTLRITFKAIEPQIVAEANPVGTAPPRAAAEVALFRALPSKIKIKPPPKAAETPAPPAARSREAGATSKVPGKAVLQDVAFDDLQVRNGEMVLFKLNRFYPPSISAQEQGRPRVICDFENTVIGRDIASHIEAKGKFVESIEVTARGQNRTRVVLNLHRGKDYDLQQVFFQEDKLFVLIVSDLVLKE